MSRPKRSIKLRDYAKLDSHGFTSDDNDVLDLTDPNSAEYDNESDEKSVKDDIEKLIERSMVRDERTLFELLGSKSHVEFDKPCATEPATENAPDQDLRLVYEQQGARPKTKPETSKVESSAPGFESVPKASSTSKKLKNVGKEEKESNTIKKKEGKPKIKKVPTKKDAKKKGEVTLDDLRANKKLTKLVESQLSDLLLGKLSLCKSSDSESKQSESESSDEQEICSKRKVSNHKKKISKKDIVSSESSSCSSDSDSDKDSSESSSSTDTKRRHKKRNKRKKKSGMVKRASDDVVNPQIWPHSLLQYEYVSKSVKYKDLDFRLFVAGELEIITSSKIRQSEKQARLALLKKIVYYSSIYQWKSLLDFYAAFLRQIETGQKTWKDDSVGLEVPLLSKYVKVDQKKTVFKKDSQKTVLTWYCALFQKNKCSKQSPHFTTIRGVSREVHHICAACYRIDKVKNVHPESSSACPHFEE